LEHRITFMREISVLLVRGVGGATAAYDIPVNTHKEGILARSSIPGGLEPAAAQLALEFARQIADALDYVGLLTVEMFDLGPAVPPTNRFVINEIAPRVHNSGHWTIEACAISQFENHIRAVAGWPLGSCVRHADAEMENLIGADALNWRTLASEPGAALHLYGKGEARPGRKMGHVTRLRPLTRPQLATRPAVDQ
jgi:5-(carboxyamino)imidazole ribonucleotide synthase